MDSLRARESSVANGIGREKPELLFQVRNRDWDLLPEVLMDSPNWRELLGRKKQ